jgi:hypothetical protein
MHRAPWHGSTVLGSTTTGPSLWIPGRM